MCAVIIVFAKAPVPGQVKTRLQPPLSPLQAADLHRAFVRDTLENIRNLDTASVELHTDILTDAWSDVGVPQCLQVGTNLQLKLLHAIENALLSGHEQVLIVGSDAPTLPMSYLTELLHAEADIALGPTDDGGYYAISARRFHRAMLDGVGWSTHTALADTKRAIEACGLSVTLGPQWWDVDEPRDLERLRATPELPRNTARAMASLGYEKQ